MFRYKIDHVIAYESQKLKYGGKNYVTCDLELAAIIHALMQWRHCLMGNKFLLKTNNGSLKYLFKHPNLNSIQGQWLHFISEYDFELRHIKGRENKVANSLSRRFSFYMKSL